MDDKKKRQKEVEELMVLDNENIELDLSNLPEPRTVGTRKLTDSQRKLALLVATRPYHGMTMIDMCELAGFSTVAGYRAMKKTEFQDYVEQILDQRNREFMSVVYKRLQDVIQNSKSEKNAIDAIKVYLTMTGKLKEVHEVSHEVKQVKDQAERERQVLEMERQLIEQDPSIFEE